LTRARRFTTRFALAGVAALVATPIAMLQATRLAAGAPDPVTVNLSWSNTLNDAPCGVLQASPIEFNDGGTQAIEIGDREGHLYGFNLADGSPAAGWGGGSGASMQFGGNCGISDPNGATPNTGVNGIDVPEGQPVDSTASVDPTNANLYFGAGNGFAAIDGGYYSYSPNGNPLWNQVVTNPSTDNDPLGGVQASLTVANDGLVEAGSLGQAAYALDAADGAPAPGWPQFQADSVFSTAATGDLYGTGSDDFVAGGASSQGFALGTHYSDGGHLRIYNDHGGLICSAQTNEEVDSSPAIGPILPGGAYGIATGTGSFYSNVSDENSVKVYDTKCRTVWSDTLDGLTLGSPALADVLGNGGLQMIEGTVTGGVSGSVYALDPANGAIEWRTPVIGSVIGSVVTADLTGQGYQDVVVPTDQGIEILDGRTGVEVAHFDDKSGNAGIPAGEVFGFQNAPVVTADPDGSIGITVAGYFALGGGTTDLQGIVQHFEIGGSSAGLADEGGGWPQFHHDPQLTGFIAGGATLGNCDRPDAAQNGYLTVASDGGIFAFGQDFCGSTGNLVLNKPVVGMAAVPGGGGYWLVASDGGIFNYGDAAFYGSTGALQLNAPVVGMAATPDGGGYWLVASDGGIFTYGDAQFYGSAASVPGQDIVGMAATPDGQGYWEVSATGRVFPFGDATFLGDARSLHLNGVIVGITADPVTGGYWLIGSDGGVFSFGAPFFGSTGNIHLNQPVVAMQSTDDGDGYWFVASDGGIFSYGDAPFRGSMGGRPLNRQMVGMFGF
jgi:hypothetical protein